MGDDISVLPERQPGRLWRHGQHAHHVQHQQQVKMQDDEISFALNVIKANLNYFENILNAGMPVEWQSW